MHTEFVYESICVQVLPFVCLRSNKQGTSVKKAVHRNRFHLKMCLCKLLTN